MKHLKAEYTPHQLRILALYGITAPLIYAAALVIGNVLDPTYSQLGKTVSELIEQGAPNRDLLNIMFLIYNLFLIPFAEGLYKSLTESHLSRLILVSFILVAGLGVVWTLFFPLDANGASTSLTGMLHLIVGGLVVPLVFIIELGFWRAAKKDNGWMRYSRFSVVVFIVTLVFGITTVVLVNSNIRGLVERITTGSFLLWIEVVALKLRRLPRPTLGAHDAGHKEFSASGSGPAGPGPP